MTDTATTGDRLKRFLPPKRASLAAAIIGGAAATMAMAVGAGGIWASFAGLMALASVASGYLLGHQDGTSSKAVRMRMFRVADELAQYRAFTRLLRDQGERITETTGNAATVIVTGLRDMDANLVQLQALMGTLPEDQSAALTSLVNAIGAPVVGMLGQLQFQDVTQQQIAFLSRLSRIVDQHMIDLAREMGDRRSMDRVGNFKDMFNKALDDCVMSSQRDDHHVAAGLDLHESNGPKIELF